MEFMIAIIFLIIGVLIGKVIFKDQPIGDLRVDRSDPTCEPYLFLELNSDVRDIMRRKNATFRVKVENFIPRK